MENCLKNVLERKGWIKEEANMADTTEYKVFHTEILPFDKVNRNNRLFSKDVVKTALEKLKGSQIPCRFDMPDPDQRNIFVLDHENTMGLAELSINGDFLVADMRIRNDSDLAKAICKGLDDGTLVPAPYGMAECNTRKDDNEVEVITDYDFTGIGIIDKSRSIM